MCYREQRVLLIIFTEHKLCLDTDELIMTTSRSLDLVTVELRISESMISTESDIDDSQMSELLILSEEVIFDEMTLDANISLVLTHALDIFDWQAVIFSKRDNAIVELEIFAKLAYVSEMQECTIIDCLVCELKMPDDDVSVSEIPELSIFVPFVI